MKKELIIIIVLLIILNFFIIDRGVVFTNENYTILLLLEVPLVYMLVYFLIAKKNIEGKTKSIIVSVIVTTGFFYSLITPINHTLLIELSDKTEEITLSGKVLSASRIKTGKSQAISYEVEYQFEDGKKKSFLVPEKEKTPSFGKFIENNLILEDSILYEKIKLVGYKSPLGFYFIRFDVE